MPAGLEAPTVAPGASELPAVGAPSSLVSVDPVADFRPTEAMVRVKARTWANLGDSAAAGLTLAAAQQASGSAALANWWGRPGFKAWFSNTSVTSERLEWLLHLSLAAAEDVLLNTDPKAQGARVQMVKVVADLLGKRAKAPEQADGKGGIETMNKAELEALLAAQGIRLERVANVAASPIPKKES